MCIMFLIFYMYAHSGEVSIQVAVEMPFDIKTLESPTHNIRMKVPTCTYMYMYKIICMYVYVCTVCIYMYV